MSQNPSGAPQEELVDVGTFSLVDPGGDPSKLRSAAAAWEARASHLRALGGRLGGEVGRLSRSDWEGEARQAFEAWWAEAADELETAARGFDDMAAQLRELADSIQEVNDAVRSIYIEIGATVAIGVAVSVVSFGLGTAATATRVAMLVARAKSLIEGLRTILHLKRAASVFSAFKATYIGAKIARYGGLYAKGVAYSAASTTASKMAFNKTVDPFANWSGTDVRNLLLGGVTGVGVGKLAGAGRIGVWTNRHRYLSAASQGFGANVTNAVAFDAIDRKVGWETLPKALVGGTVGAVTGLGVARVIRGRPGTSRPYGFRTPAGWRSVGRSNFIAPGPDAPATTRVSIYGRDGTRQGTAEIPTRGRGLYRPEILRPSPPRGFEARRPSGLWVVPPEKTAMVELVRGTQPVRSNSDLHVLSSPEGTEGGYSPGSQPLTPQQQTMVREFFPAYVGEGQSQVEKTLERHRPVRPTWQVPSIEATPPPPPPPPVPARP